jgi:hypothetical protein
LRLFVKPQEGAVAASGEKSNLALPAVLFTILAALGLGAPLLKSSAPPTPASNPSALSGSRREASYPHSAADLLLDFFDSNTEQFEPAKPWFHGACVGSDTLKCGDDSAAGYQVQFIIATIPDPDSVPLRYKFDSFLDAISEAANIAGFNLFSFDLPWLDTAKETAGGFKLAQEVDIAPSDERDQEADADRKSLFAIKPSDTRRSHKDPGIMLFRQRQSRYKQLLVVFIVGERPDTGVDAPTLRSALDQVAWLSGWRHNNDAQQYAPPSWLGNLTAGQEGIMHLGKPEHIVYLVGPAYSTSRVELDLIFQRWRDSFGGAPRNSAVDPISEGPPDEPKVIAISGSAAGVLSKQEAVTHLVSDVDVVAPQGINYYSTLVQNDALWSSIACDLENGPARSGLVVPHVGSCVDSDSTHGSSVQRPPLFALLVPDNAPTLPLEVIKRVLFVPYPSHISDVRTAFGKIPADTSMLARPLGRRDLGMADESGEQEPDVVPAFSGRSAMYDELSLSTLFATINRERIRRVGIVASDVEDLVFLVRQLRQWCPNAIVFTTGADLRFLHSDVNPELEGMLVFSTYPLFTLNQQWTSRPGSRPLTLEFSSDEAEGVYNATLKLLATLDQSTASPYKKMRFETVEYGAPFVNYGAPDVNSDPTPGAPLVNRSPVLWVSVVGDDSLWPIAFHYIDNRAHKLYSIGSEYRAQPRAQEFSTQFNLDWIPYPPSFRFGGLALMVLCFIPGFLYLSQGDHGKDQFWLSSFFKRYMPANPVWLHMLIGPHADFGSEIDSEIQETRRIYLATFLIILLLAYLLGFSFFLLPVVSGFQLQGWGGLNVRTHLQALVFGLAALITLAILSVATAKAVTSALRSEESSIPPPTPSTPSTSRERAGRIFSAFLKQLPLWAAAVLFFFGAGFIISRYIEPIPMRLFEFTRASHLWNGVSSLRPLLFVGLGGLCMAICGLRELNLLQECRIERPFLGFDRGALSFLAIGKCEKEVVQRVECQFFELPLARAIETLILAAWFYFILLRQHNLSPVDGSWFNWLFNASFITVYVLFSGSLLRFVSIWWSLRSFLRTLYWHLSRTAYEELRQKTVPARPEAQHITIFEPRPSLTAIEAALTFARDLFQSATLARATEARCRAPLTTKTGPLLDKNGVSLKALPSPYTLSDRLADVQCYLGDRICEAEIRLTQALRAEAYEDPAEAIRTRRAAQAAIARLSVVISEMFEPVWRTILLPSMAALSKEDEKLLESGKLFIAVRVVDLLRQVFPQLLNLAGFSMAAALAMTLAVSGYPFPDHDTMLWFSWVILLSVIATILVVFIQMNRDRVLSMLTGGTPGRLDWNGSFVFQILAFGVLPVLTLLGAQFPQAFNGMLSWLGGLFGGNK